MISKAMLIDLVVTGVAVIFRAACPKGLHVYRFPSERPAGKQGLGASPHLWASAAGFSPIIWCSFLHLENTESDIISSLEWLVPSK